MCYCIYTVVYFLSVFLGGPEKGRFVAQYLIRRIRNGSSPTAWEIRTTSRAVDGDTVRTGETRGLFTVRYVKAMEKRY